jgi:hypothetical protein
MYMASLHTDLERITEERVVLAGVLRISEVIGATIAPF